jgi:UDP-2,4-diacetamido-2,4,6-trideoxy-beta-L-altropyranose hydrolase
MNAASSQTLACRCDGTPATGLGHLSRCLGLAEALAERGVAVRFFGEYGPTARTMLAAAEVAFEEMTGWEAADLTRRLGGMKGVIVDSYLADADYVARVNQAAPALVIDDFARLGRYECAAVLNFTVAAETLAYPLPRRRCLLGPGYLLVRRKLRRVRATMDPPGPRARRVVLSFGGGAWLTAARTAMDALLEIAPQLEVTVVAGSEEDAAMQALASRFGGGGRIVRGLPDLGELFSSSDACIAGGGLTKYEAAYLGLPVAVLSRTLDESAETTRFAAAGLAIDLGSSSDVDRGRVERGVACLIGDEDARRRLHAATRARFAADPTGEAARVWLDILSEGEP